MTDPEVRSDGSAGNSAGRGGGGDAPAPNFDLAFRGARLLRRGAWFGLAATLIGLSIGARFGLSVLAGAVLSLLNLHALRRMVRGLGASVSARASLAVLLFSGLRYLLIGGALAAIIGVWRADVLGVVCGLAAPVAAVLFEAAGAGFGVFRAGSAPGDGGPPPPDRDGAGPPDRSASPDPPGGPAA